MRIKLAFLRRVIFTFVFNIAVITFDHLNPQENRFCNIHFFNYTNISLEHFISCREGAWVHTYIHTHIHTYIHTCYIKPPQRAFPEQLKKHQSIHPSIHLSINQSIQEINNLNNTYEICTYIDIYTVTTVWLNSKIILLRSRYENATPNLCWVFCALLGNLCN